MLNDDWSKKGELVRFSDINSRKIEYLVHNKIPLGMVTLLAGDPGVGKSYLSLFIASLVSNGGAWPDGSLVTKGSVLLLNGEDHLECTLKPRLEIFNADCSKILAYKMIKHKDQNGNITLSELDLKHDIDIIEKTLIEHPELRLVIVDPVSSYFGSTDTHRDAAVRSVFTPLIRLAEKYNVAILCIIHLNKSLNTRALYKVTGSIAFTGAARVLWMVIPDPYNPQSKQRFLMLVKSNVLDNPVNMSFYVDNNKRLVFSDKPVTLTVEEMFCLDERQSRSLVKAVDFLKQRLSEGPVASKELDNLAETEGISRTTLTRAKKEIGVKFYEDFDEQGISCYMSYLKEQRDNRPISEILKDIHERSKKQMRAFNKRLKL
jgi:putative DNA primase/helicase